MISYYPHRARAHAIATVFVLGFGLLIATAGAPEPFVFPQDEYAPMMFKRLKEIGGGPTLNENGLTGVKWGAPLASFPHMKLVENMGRTGVTDTNGLYRNGDENLTVNGATISQVLYWFVDEHLGSVSLSYKGRENWGRLKQWVEQWYGPLERADKSTPRFDAKLQQWVKEGMTVSEMPTDPKWSGELSWKDAATEVRFTWNPKTETGELLMISPVLNELHAYEGVGGGDC